MDTGDLIHADLHGVQLVPASIAAQVPAAADRVCECERRIIDYCKSPHFSPEGLKRLMAECLKESQ